MINWHIKTKEEYELISNIAKRAVELFDNLRLLETQMDIIACHVNGNPLRLKELLEADDYEFAHDVLGIRRHIDRDTGKLQDFFVPRFSE